MGTKNDHEDTYLDTTSFFGGENVLRGMIMLRNSSKIDPGAPLKN